MFKRKSIFGKLFLTSLLVLLLSFIMFAVIFNYLLHNVLLKGYQDTLYYQRDRISEYINMAADKGIDEEVFQSSLSLSMDQEYQTAVIFNSNGEAAYNFDSTNKILRYIKPEIIEKALNNEEVAQKIKGQGRPFLVVAGPMEISSAEEPRHAFVVVFHGFDQNMDQIRLLNLTAIIVTIVLTGIIIYFASRKITAPLRELNEHVLKFAKGDFSEKVKIKRKDEIGQLGESVNYMAKELASIDQMRKDFVANVSHDLRSPLTSIKGFLVAILDGTIPEGRRNHYLMIMKNETERLIKLVNDLLELTKLESNPLKISPENYNISEQLRLVIAKMEPEIMKHEIEVEFMEEQEDLYANADSDRIEQVLINLLQNAIHFSPKRSKVEIQIGKNEKEVFINIKDFGKGISEDELSRIWERFYKVDKARTNKLGAGIGLSIVKQILDLHQVPINVMSKVGEGTEFSFSLPLAK